MVLGLPPLPQLPSLPFLDSVPCPFRGPPRPKVEPALPPGHLRWSKTLVQGRPAVYGEAGEGPPVVFLHGWGLGHHTYKRPLARLALRGCRVLAPALPGVDEPAIVIGHSFGGGVAITLAHDYRSRVAKLVLVNSVGGAAWGDGDHHLGERPLIQWVAQFAKELWPPQKGLALAISVREDLVPNLLFSPRAMFTAGVLAARADLRDELAELRARQLPVVVLSGADDGVIPLSAFDALCSALGIEGRVMPGDHSWLLADPDAFDEVMANVVGLGPTLRDLALGAD
jgi:pimeloyl-ACP methyl ester carboxylesterase